MTPEQYELIRQKAKWTDWKIPQDRNVQVRQVLFDLHDLLPDDNVEAFLRDSPAPGGWGYITDDDTGKKSWFWRAPFERRQWYASCEIDLEKTATMNPQEITNYEKAQEEIAFLTLVTLLEAVTCYAARKTDSEREAMYAEFEKLRLAGPPTNGTDS